MSLRRGLLWGMSAIGALLFAAMLGRVSVTSLSSPSDLAFVLLVAPALALVRSQALPIYILAVWVCAPEVRRYVDFVSGQYHALSPISIAPVVCTLTLLIPLLTQPPRLSRSLRLALQGFVLAFLYAFALGFWHNHFAAIWEMLNYAVPLLLVLYVQSRQPDTQIRDRWIMSLSVLAVLVALYGWVQFLTVPPWDAFWMENSGMASIGQPKPLLVRVFSTLNSPGPAANFFAIALAPMLFERKWRRPFGFAGVFVVASALALTLVRSAWLMLMVAVLIYVFRARRANRVRALVGIGAAFIVVYLLIPHLPGASVVMARGQTFADLSQDHSATVRLRFTLGFLPQLLHHLTGVGFGSTGVATKLTNDGQLGVYGNFDNGVLDLFYTFGLVCGLVFFIAEWMVGKALASISPLAPHSSLALALLLAMNLELLSVNVLSGMGGLLLWYVVAVALPPPPVTAVDVPNLECPSRATVGRGAWR
ncbi:O-antigen ligase family protein [Alicyclobacillus herbarius]|uniref:O-antigen ligase family protein n=1 Tax=Alicyclobacillus herbarius TaxID=122960 RepID=UPI000407A2E3|nr:O-antigen ligase family protein [Alicyclobacillus herbarius]